MKYKCNPMTAQELILKEQSMTNTEQILKEFDERFVEEDDVIVTYKEYLRPWLEEKFASQKQQILDAVEKGRIKVTNNWAYTHDRDDEQYTKLSKEEININKGIDKALTIIKNL